MRRLRPLLDELRDRAFTRAEAAAAGVGDGRLRGPGVVRPFRGIYRDATPRDLLERCEALAPRLAASDAFSHSTALGLWGAPLADDGRGPVHVTRSGSSSRITGAGISGHRSTLPLPTELVLGLRVVAPAVAWRQAAEQLSLDDLIAAGDAIMSERITASGRTPPRTDVAGLRRALDAAPGARGTANAWLAVPWIREGVHSRAETRLRLVLVRDGLPEPVTQHPVDVGGGVLHPDLAWPELRIGLEYEGDEHRLDRARWRADITRRERFEAAGWRVIRVHHEHLGSPSARAEFLTRVRVIRWTREVELGLGR
ncbi:MAG: hypothetical protein J0G30_08625 [Actinomycetales bacterium]|nr:hypothetical protein [Actinomycetales bacterium]